MDGRTVEQLNRLSDGWKDGQMDGTGDSRRHLAYRPDATPMPRDVIALEFRIRKGLR